MACLAVSAIHSVLLGRLLSFVGVSIISVCGLCQGLKMDNEWAGKNGAANEQ